MKHYQRTNELNTTHLLLGFLILSCVGMVLVSCKQEGVRSYSVPREFDGAAAIENQFESNVPDEQSLSSEVIWHIPESWNELETEVSMRIATFMTPPGIEVTLAAFPGDVGGLLANVNRWRGQVGLDPVDEQTLAESAVEIEGTNSFVIDVAGSSVRLIGTVINVGDGQTWFVKTIGQAEAVEQIKADIITFSASFHLREMQHSEDDGHNHGADDGHNQSESPAEPTNTSTKNAAPATNAAQGDAWEQPTQWTVDSDASPILMAAFNAESGARITLTALGGGGGGTLDNINRWRNQLGLPLVESLADQPSQDLGNNSLIVDLISEDNESRIVAGIVPVDSQTLFFKLTGSVSETESELERFNAFIRGVGFGRQGEP